ncbi:MAG: zinc ribbon domain-containing protein [Hespellia sp.]|nr:zinc ribbon domain-containing protein [Hespellia sp.]
MKKWEKTCCNMNLKKAVITYIIAGIVFVVVAAGVGYANFGSRLSKVEESDKKTESVNEDSENRAKSDMKGTDAKATKEYKADENDGDNSDSENRNDKQDIGGEHDSERDWESMLSLNNTDEIILGVIAVIVGLFILCYWLLVLVWAVQKSEKMGTRTSFWAVLTLLFNLGAVIGLYLYGIFCGTCKECGHIKVKNARYCVQCGARFVTVCKECGADYDVEDQYCKNCGAKTTVDMSQKKEEKEEK